MRLQGIRSQVFTDRPAELYSADEDILEKGYEGDTLKLAATDIPAVGTKPNDTYKAGRWDTMPSAETAITATTTYTYTYAAKEASVVTKAPKAKTLTYNGQERELVTDGEASGGTLYYAVTTEDKAPAESLYTTSIPTGNNAGTYYVWYKVKGDENHSDAAPAGPVTVTIKAVGLTEENKIVSDSLTSVPDELNNRFSSIKDLKDALLRVLSSQGMFASEENSVFYDVVLMVWRNGGPWVPGTKEGFADGPLTVKLEYTF